MRQTRVFVEAPLVPGQCIALPPEASRHLRQVLRLGAGASITLFNGDGYEYAACLESIERQSAHARVLSQGECEPEPVVQIHLALGISRGERMDYALQKAVELGVTSLTPLLTERTVVRLDAKRLERRLEHWRGVILAACEQSARRRLAQLHPPLGLADWLKQAPAGTLVLDPQADRALTALAPPAHGALSLLIGPEGGLSPKEREQAWQAQCLGVRLGPRVLRTETAPLAAIAVIQALWGDF